MKKVLTVFPSILDTRHSELGKKGDVLKKNSFYSAMRLFATLFPQGLSRRRRRTFLIGFVVATFCMGVMFSPMRQVAFAQSGNPQKPTQEQTDVQRLEGRWLRPDGGYILELWDIRKDGDVSAAYYNPRPIKVFSAKWSRKEGKINLFVELRDVNYPGSKYNLQYDPKSDRLKGTYFQAVEKQTYNIEFVRFKNQ